MLSKENFVKIINDLKKESDYIDEINKVNINYQKDEYVMLPQTYDTVINLLGGVFGLEDSELIYWWVFDMDFGRNFKMGDILLDGEEIDLSTPELLYDYLKTIKEENNEL